MNDSDRFEREVMAEKWEEEQAERAEHLRQQAMDDKIDFPDRERIDAMVKDWAERDREQAWQKFSAEMQKNIDKLNQLRILK